MEKKQYDSMIRLLNRELVPALGCTEPIAIAFAAAALNQALGGMPDHVDAACSGNIIKNVQGVIVPGTGNLRGVAASVAMGIICGDMSLELEVLSNAMPKDVIKARELIDTGFCEVSILDSEEPLHIVLTGTAGGNTAVAEVRGGHTDLVRLERNGELLLHRETAQQAEDDPECELLTSEAVYEFVQTFAIEDLKALLDRQIEYNLAIAEEGLTKRYGGSVGASMLLSRGNDVRTMACAYPAAGSDARMGGCMLPVVINSGSGNQGLTVSLPVIIFARDFCASDEQRYRALALSNLMALQQKQYIGKLSAFCGAVCAGCGAGAGIAYLAGFDLPMIENVVMNTLAIVSGMVCDGAKASCAGKIASAVNAAILAVDMTAQERSFAPGTGILGRCEADTVSNIGRMARDGMKKTDEVILNIMIGK